MQRTLVDRFRGALLGAVVGYYLGTQVQGKSYRERRRWQQQAGLAIDDLHLPIHPVVSLMLHGVHHLVHHKRWVAQDWHQLQQKVLLDQVDGLTEVEIAIATLPIALFFHEENTKLQQQLQQGFSLLKGKTSQGTQQEDSGFLAVQTIGWAIANILQERLDPTTTIAEMLRQTQNLDIPWVDQLRQIQVFLETNASLEAVRMHGLKFPTVANRGNSIVSALYSFLATPGEFRLSLLRSTLIDDQPELTCTLVGAVSGCYNGLTGIPTGWRLATKPLNSMHHQSPSNFLVENQVPPLLPDPQKPLTSEIVQLADLLLAAWSGVFAPGTIAITTHQKSAIAAPRVIRPQRDS